MKSVLGCEAGLDLRRGLEAAFEHSCEQSIRNPDYIEAVYMSLVRKSLLMIGGIGAVTFLSALQGIIIARVLGPEGMGQFQLVITSGVMIMTFFVFGLSKANVYFLNHHREDANTIIVNSAFFSVVLGLSSSIFLYLLFSYGHAFTGDYDTSTKLIFSLGLLFLFFQVNNRFILLAKMRVVEFNLTQLGGSVLSVTLIGWLAYAGTLSINNALKIIVASYLLNAALTYLFLRVDIKGFSLPDFKLLWRTLKYGFQLHAVNLLITMDNSIGVIFLGLLLSGEFDSIGYYSRAVAICVIIKMIPAALSSLLYSHWSSVEGDRKTRQAERVLRIYLFLGIAIVLLIYAFGKHLIVLLYGEAFLPAYATLLVLSIQQVLWMLSTVFQSLFTGSGRPMLVTYGMLLTTVLKVSGLILLIPRMGIIGAALAVTVGDFVYLVINYRIATRHFGLISKHSFIINSSDLDILKGALMRREG